MISLYKCLQFNLMSKKICCKISSSYYVETMCTLVVLRYFIVLFFLKI